MELPKLDTGSLGSPFADQLNRGFARLRFAGLLEKEFRDFYVAQNLPRARLSGLIALILVLAISLPGARRYYTEVAAVGVTLVGLVVTYISHLAALQGQSYVLAGLVLV